MVPMTLEKERACSQGNEQEDTRFISHEGHHLLVNSAGKIYRAYKHGPSLKLEIFSKKDM